MNKLKLLVVEDVEVHRFLIVEGIKRIKPFWKIDVANGGLQGQEMLMQNSYDMILCDWLMPDMSGADLLRWARSYVATSKIPFIMITAKDDKEDIIDAFMELKVDGYILKPFTGETIIKKISTVMKSRGVDID